jgi:hypothetical protein
MDSMRQTMAGKKKHFFPLKLAESLISCDSLIMSATMP